LLVVHRKWGIASGSPAERTTARPASPAPLLRAHRCIHVGLDFGLGEGAVVDADLVDAALKNSPHILFPPMRSGPVEVAIGPLMAMLAVCTPLMNSRKVVPS